MPKERKVTYSKNGCEYKPKKAEKECTTIALCGDRIGYQGKVPTKMADITTIKCLVNSVVSTSNGKFAPEDVNNLFS